MESTFCKNFVCCSIPLDDLHDLLEHYEQAHCHQSSSATATNDSSSSTERPDLVVFDDEDEWSGTESGSTNPSTRPGFDRSRSPPEDWPVSSFISKDSSNHSRRKHQTDHWSKMEDGFGIPPSLLDGQNPANPTSSADPHQFLLMADGDEDGLGSGKCDWNTECRPRSDASKKQRLASEQLDWQKPYRCSVPGCEKAYKQPNGLKYHQTHGHCSQTALTIEEESKSFVCHDLVCGKRYKSVNGLRYHYQHTGPHGTIGLQLLTLGLHPSAPAPNAINLDTDHPHRHPLLTSVGSSCTGGSQDGSVSGLASDGGDVVMDDQ